LDFHCRDDLNARPPSQSWLRTWKKKTSAEKDTSSWAVKTSPSMESSLQQERKGTQYFLFQLYFLPSKNLLGHDRFYTYSTFKRSIPEERVRARIQGNLTSSIFLHVEDNEETSKTRQIFFSDEV
jgi:hypothetical protein